MLRFPWYSLEQVDPHIQTLRAVWPAKENAGYGTDKPSGAMSPPAPAPRGRGDIQSNQASSGRKSEMGAT